MRRMCSVKGLQEWLIITRMWSVEGLQECSMFYDGYRIAFRRKRSVCGMREGELLFLTSIFKMGFHNLFLLLMLRDVTHFLIGWRLMTWLFTDCCQVNGLLLRVAINNNKNVRHCFFVIREGRLSTQKLNQIKHLFINLKALLTMLLHNHRKN